MQKQLSTPQFKKRIASLLSYMVQRLALRQVPTLELKHNVENSKKDFGYTGDYDRVQKRIRIYVTGRHENDILRTFAHEVIHHWQNERGVLAPEDGTPSPEAAHQGVDGDQEVDSSYAQTDEHLRKCEFEAYLFGNILFRDWQDQNRHGAPQQAPALPPTFV